MFKSVIERIKKDKECPIHNKLDKIFSIDMYNNKFFGNVKNNNAIRQFNCNNEYIFTFPFNKNNDEMQIPVYFYGKEYINNKENMSIYPRMIFGKSNMTAGESICSNFWTLKISNDCNFNSKIICNFSDCVVYISMEVMITMREVHANTIDTSRNDIGYEK